jgi:hypothetical protein
MSDTIRRYKDDHEMTPGDWLELAGSGKRSERDEYREARRQALEAAGLEPDDDNGPPADIGEWTADDHLNDIRKDN